MRASAFSRRSPRSDPHPLALLAECAAQIAELVLDESINAITRRANRLAHVVLDAIHGDAVDELAAMLARPFRSRGTGAQCASAGAPRAAKHRSERALPGRTASEQERRRGADRGADEGRRK